MTMQMFINVPVKDLDRSKGFFEALGFKVNAQFTNEQAACIVVSEHHYIMLLVEPFFATFTPKTLVDAKTQTEQLVALSHPSREAVDAIVAAAVAAGGRSYAKPVDHGFMYQWGFEDLDGHLWEHFWMDPAAVNPVT
ncbi:MAG: VOC family protein [Myxococcales bacterium]|nr:VOC family protein [Myxococcales bacterium]